MAINFSGSPEDLGDTLVRGMLDHTIKRIKQELMINAEKCVDEALEKLCKDIRVEADSRIDYLNGRPQLFISINGVKKEIE